MQEAAHGADWFGGDQSLRIGGHLEDVAVVAVIAVRFSLGVLFTTEPVPTLVIWTDHDPTAPIATAVPKSAATDSARPANSEFPKSDPSHPTA